MGDKSKIEWTDATWNPVRARSTATGKVRWHCEHASEGCRFCYAEGINRRLGTGLDFKPGHRKDVEIFLDEKMLLAPLRWRRPRMIFVCSMTDAFAKFVTDEMLDKMFAVAALCPNHTLQFLTKRSSRMRAYFADPNTKVRVWDRVCDMAIERGVDHVVLIAPGVDPELAPRGTRVFLGQWPLPNVWLGVSCEDQENADARRDDLRLLAEQGWLTFVSYEPALGPVDWSGWEFLRWLISGGESGPKARPSHPDWHRAARDFCTPRGIAYFFKQWGEWAPPVDSEGWLRTEGIGPLGAVFENAKPIIFPRGELHVTVSRMGKKAAGRLLDGREHNDMPRPPA